MVLVEKAEEDYLELWARLSCGALNLYLGNYMYVQEYSRNMTVVRV